MSVRLLITKITNPIFLTYELIIGNRRLIIPTMIGLFIALTVISQSGVLIESYRQEIFEEVVVKQLEDYYYDDGDIMIEMRRWDFSQSGESRKITDFDYYNTLINRSIDRVNYSDYISNYFWYSRVENYIWLNRTEEYPSEGIQTRDTPLYVSSATKFYSALEQILNLTGKGRLPKNSSEIILIRPKWDPKEEGYIKEYEKFENVSLGAKVNITFSPEWHGGGPNKTVKIVGVIEYTSGDYSFPDNSTSLLKKYYRWLWWGYAFISQT